LSFGLPWKNPNQNWKGRIDAQGKECATPQEDYRDGDWIDIVPTLERKARSFNRTSPNN
jgi:hypothetical protein